jgi:hypothetical protein
VTHRALSAWFLSEGGLLGWAGYGIAEDPSVGWSWQGLDDFNGDGRLDVIWRNLVDNRTKAWLIGDNGVLEEPFYNDLEPSSMWLLGIPN